VDTPSLEIESVVRDPDAAPGCTLIWLHGLGADGYDFEPLARSLGLPRVLGARFVFPHAPVMPVTINRGYRMRAWYDIRDQDIFSDPDYSGIDRSVQLLIDLVYGEAEKVPIQRIVLAGFSQGGVIALRTALGLDSPVAGVIALSTYLPLPNSEVLSDNPFPVFWGHGIHDPVVPIRGGEAARQWLSANRHEVSWHTYPMQHAVCSEELEDVRRWLMTIL
jgi:phospholipase/carboxylesterase